MAKATPELIDAINNTIARLRAGADYQWTHMGRCNCGHLAQSITNFSQEELHKLALQKAGDWGQKAIDYCPDSGFPIDHIISVMVDIGLNTDDLYSLERLSSPRILKRLPAGRRYLQHNSRDDLLLYLKTWAEMLEEELGELKRDPIEQDFPLELTAETH